MRISRRASGGKIPSSPLTESSALATSGLVGNSVTTGYGIGQSVIGQSSGITSLSPEAVLHFSRTHNRLFVSRYLTVLPSAEQLQRFVETDRARVEAAMEQNARARAKPVTAKRKRKKAKSSRRR